MQHDTGYPFAFAFSSFISQEQQTFWPLKANLWKCTINVQYLWLPVGPIMSKNHFLYTFTINFPIFSSSMNSIHLLHTIFFLQKFLEWIFSDFWNNLTIFDDFWNRLMIFDDFWNNLVSFGDFWKHLMIFNDFWNYLIIFRDFWNHLMIFDDFWNHLMFFRRFLKTFNNFWWFLKWLLLIFEII